jgi:hypothetical protein
MLKKYFSNKLGFILDLSLFFIHLRSVHTDVPRRGRVSGDELQPAGRPLRRLRLFSNPPAPAVSALRPRRRLPEAAVHQRNFGISFRSHLPRELFDDCLFRTIGFFHE